MCLLLMYFFIRYNVFVLFVYMYVLSEIIYFSLISLIIRKLRHIANVSLPPVQICNYLIFNVF